MGHTCKGAGGASRLQNSNSRARATRNAHTLVYSRTLLPREVQCGGLAEQTKRMNTLVANVAQVAVSRCQAGRGTRQFLKQKAPNEAPGPRQSPNATIRFYHRGSLCDRPTMAERWRTMGRVDGRQNQPGWSVGVTERNPITKRKPFSTNGDTRRAPAAETIHRSNHRVE